MTFFRRRGISGNVRVFFPKFLLFNDTVISKVLIINMTFPIFI